MRDLQANDKQQSHDENTQYLRKMYANPQKSVDSINHIRFEGGMDEREMRKKMNNAMWDFIAGYHRLDDFVDYFLKDNDIDRLTPSGLTHEKRLRKLIAELRD